MTRYMSIKFHQTGNEHLESIECFAATRNRIIRVLDELIRIDALKFKVFEERANVLQCG